jgi:cytochrome c-type biogenesis protein CcmH/NrfF
MTVLAHAGHWFISLLYVMPVLVVVIALAIQSRRERRRDAEEGEEEPV